MAMGSSKLSPIGQAGPGAVGIKIKSKFAIDEFYRWYMEPMDREGSAVMLF